MLERYFVGGFAYSCLQRIGSFCTTAFQTAAQFLSERAGADDTVIFTRLSRKPVEWYWQNGTAQRFSFPATTDRHPGYEEAPPEAALRAEASQIADRLHGRVFVLADPDLQRCRILLEELSKRGKQRQPFCLDCEQAGKHYFSKLIQFDFRP